MLPASISLQMVMVAAVLSCATVCAALLVTSGRRDRLRQRIAFVSRVHGLRDSTARDKDLRWHHRVGAFLAESPLIGSSEFEKIGTALAQAGFRGDRTGFAFITIKFLCFVGAVMAGGLMGLTFGWLQDLSLLEISGLLAAGLFSWRTPDLVLSRIRFKRRRGIERGLSDAIDLLVICAEAGLSLEVGLERVRRDLQQAHPGLSEELQITIAEMRLLADRRLALENLITRTGIAAVRSIVTTLSQTLRYGTPLAASLRVIAAELRQARMLRIEERVGRLPVLLTLPMIIFILPCLFLVIAGPAAFDLIDLINAG